MSKNLLAPFFSWKKSLPPFLSQKKTRCPLFFAEKLGAPFFSLKKVVALFFYLKKSRRPSVDKPGPGTPINFGRSLMPVTFSPEITRFTLWLSQHQVPATFLPLNYMYHMSMFLRKCGDHSLAVHKCFEDASKRFGSQRRRIFFGSVQQAHLLLGPSVSCALRISVRRRLWPQGPSR